MINETFLLNIADFVGIASFALSGFYVATKDRLDLLGIFIASFLTALGGGIIRDLIVNTTPFTFSHSYPVLIVIIVLFLSILFKLHKKDKILKSNLLIFSDSVGLVSFSISGALVGLNAEFSLFGVALLAVITATGGGVMRDILLKRSLHSSNPHNINRFYKDKAIVCRTNLLIQKRLTQYLWNLLIPVGKSTLRQSSKDKSSRINKLVLRILSFKSYLKLGFCGGCYCAVVS